jgi:hypothetical protein
MKTPLETRGSRANDGKSARLGKKQPDGTHAHRIAHVRSSRPLPPPVRTAVLRPGRAGRGGGKPGPFGSLTGKHAGLFPVGPQRHSGPPVRGQPHAQHLVQLDLVTVEPEP